MALPKFLCKRGDTYYVRRPIPQDVQPAFGGRLEIQRSLRTKSRREAETRSHAVLAELANMIEAKRRIAAEGEDEARFMRSDAADVALREHYRVANRMANAVAPYSWHSPEEAEAEALAIQLGAVTPRPRSRGEALVAIQADLDQLQFEADHASLVTAVDEDGEPIFGSIPERYVPALMERLRELIEADRRSLEAQASIFADVPKPPESAPGTLSLTELSARWAELRNPAMSSRADMRTAISRFEKVNGPLPFFEITAEHARRFKDDLVRDGNLKNATRAKLWGMLRLLMNVAKDDALLAGENPFAVVTLRLKDDSARREVLTRDDLLALFRVLEDREEWWLARLGLYTGARLGEIVQLTKADVRTLGVVPVLSIREDPEAGRRVKTRSSIREVPIHQQLLADGFLDWVEARPTEALFSIAAAPASKRMNRRMREAGLGEGKVFHSLRHTFKGVARRHMEQEWHDRLTGHAAKSVGQGYGDYELGALKERLDRVAFGTEEHRSPAA